MRSISIKKAGAFVLALAAALCVAILFQPAIQQATAAPTPQGATPAPTLSTDPNDFTSQGSIPFSPITIADLGPVTTNANFLGGLVVSGDWVAYGTSHIVCGHCGNVTGALYAQNLITGLIKQIKGSSQNVAGGDGRVGIAKIELHGTILTWTQPATPPGIPATPGTNPTSFAAGDFDCDSCYYDLSTGNGGQWMGGPLPPNPPSNWAIDISSYNPNDNSHQTITVTQLITAKIAFKVTFNGYWTATGAAFDATKMVYIQSQTGYGVPQLIRVVWLLPGDPAFTNVWTKADAAVAAGKAARSWLWGPAPILTRPEQYVEGKDGRRLVQYYDKSRMEINNPDANPSSQGYVTNGLLTVEMISGEMQIGDIARIQASVPCTIPVAGDPRKDNPLTPGYKTLLGVATIHGENQAAQRTDQPVNDSIDVNGVVGKDTSHANLAKYAAYSNETKHNIPDIFWKYLTGMQGTYGFDRTFVLGYPITEAYWTQMRVGGKDIPVLIQAYQRRVLTYIPNFPPTWQVQQGNVGQHYLEWVTRNRVNKLVNPDIGPQ
jgi:hypothetical protein